MPNDGHATYKSSAVEIRPYRCPGCNAEISTGSAAALKHMTRCAPLQDMIAIGRAGYEVRCKKKVALRNRDINIEANIAH